mmetsp:Transcript_14707/g.25441  ORF Transcript_14707/g.25441 Transcript_14707/m.25441 type:complete len:222 (+) Transcript_14707:1922-2587(+)
MDDWRVISSPCACPPTSSVPAFGDNGSSRKPSEKIGMVAGVCSSMNNGTRILTLDFLLSLIFLVKVANLGCGLITSSLTKKDRAAGPMGYEGGSVNTPHPNLGNAGSETINSSWWSIFWTSLLLNAILCSTNSRSATKQRYGTPGVPSTIQFAYSGLHNTSTVLPDGLECLSSSCNSLMISGARSDNKTRLFFVSFLTMIYSTSSPHLSTSPRRVPSVLYT